MELVYRVNFDIRNNDTDPFGRLKASSILSMMQDAATLQCRKLGVDGEALGPKGLFWAVTRQQVFLTGSVRVGGTITVETWPGVTSRVAYPRSTVGYDESGNEVFRAISLWVLMDMNSRSLVLPGKSGLDFTGIHREGDLSVPASLAPAKLSGNARRQVVYSELDCNGHMNNARYLDWMADLLPSAFHREHPLAEFTVCYLSEAREAEAVKLSYELSGEGRLQLEAAKDADGHRLFAIRSSYR